MYWPASWIKSALDAAGIPVTDDTVKVMRAWNQSTPIPPMTNNPIGMPSGTLGAPRYLNTAYAIFPSMAAFYAAFKAFSKSHAGATLALAITSKTPFSQSWRSIASLAWPASKTETDYPSAILDLTSEQFRLKVQASDKSNRKTSGTVGTSQDDKAAVISGMMAAHQVTASGLAGREAVRAMIRKVI